MCVFPQPIMVFNDNKHLICYLFHLKINTKSVLPSTNSTNENIVIITSNLISNSESVKLSSGKIAFFSVFWLEQHELFTKSTSNRVTETSLVLEIQLPQIRKMLLVESN